MITMISVNNTLQPKTGGDYVYKVMKDELLKRKYLVHEVSVPIMLKNLIGSENPQNWKEVYRLLLHLRCVIQSFFERYLKKSIVITSSFPVFPVFGHLVYHQPKAGTGIRTLKGYVPLYWRIGWVVLENEWVSPIWYLAKRSHVLHFSNSYFTKQLVKKLYGLDSTVLYPPVPVEPYLKTDLKSKRNHSVVIAKPEVPSGITMLPQILHNLPKNIKFIIMGRTDHIGMQVIQTLKRRGFNIKYLGYVSIQEKTRLLQSCSHYLHLGFNEAFGVTVAEAMAAGCIPIAHKSGGIPEYLPENLLYSNPSEAAEKILNRIGIDNLDLKIQLRHTAMRFSEENFRANFSNYFERIVKLLKESGDCEES